MTPTLESLIDRGVIVAVAGSLSTHLGMGEERFREIGALCGTLIHCASHVSHVASYWSMKPANVDATTDLIKLMCGGGGRRKRPIVHYVSTVSVLAGDDDDETYVGDTAFIGKYGGGYAQTKWVGEMRFRAAAKAGLIRLSIVRPGLICPDTRNGSSNHTDWFVRFVSGCILAGAYRVSPPPPGTVEPVKMNVTPVDHAAAIVCALLGVAKKQHRDRTKEGGEEAPAVAVFHLPLTISMPVDDMLAHVADASATLLDRKLRRIGVAGEAASPAWTNLVDTLPDNNPMAPFRGMFRENGLGGVAGHVHRATSEALVELAGFSGEVVVGEEGLGAAASAAAVVGYGVQCPRYYRAEEVALMVDFVGETNAVSNRPMLLRTASDGGRGGTKAKWNWRKAGLKVKAAVALRKVGSAKGRAKA